MTAAPTEGVRVRGGASAEELAVVLAMVAGAASGAGTDPGPSGYERWRRVRLAALRRSPGSTGPARFSR